MFKEKPVEYIDGQRKELKEYLLGFFTGLNNYNKVVIFACVITSKDKKEDQRDIFKAFFHHMGGQPETLVTDQDTATIACIKDMIMRDETEMDIYDSWHYLKSLKLKGYYRYKAHQAIFAMLNADDEA